MQVCIIGGDNIESSVVDLKEAKTQLTNQQQNQPISEVEQIIGGAYDMINGVTPQVINPEHVTVAKDEQTVFNSQREEKVAQIEKSENIPFMPVNIESSCSSVEPSISNIVEKT